jgi:hypothetical protein
MSQRSTFAGRGDVATLPAGLRTTSFDGHEQRSHDPIDRLSRTLDDVCVSAVDPLEIAAALESAGVTDSVARNRYARDDVFDLAETLHQRVPLRSRGEVTNGAQVVPPSVRRVGRGALFALPGVFYLAVQDAFSSRIATAILIAVTIGGWAVSQAISVLAYRILARSGPAAVNGFLRRCLAGSVLGAVAIGGLGGWLGHWQTGLATFAVAQAVYIVAATILVHLSADGLLAMALAPGVFVAGIAVLSGSRELSTDVVATMTASVALTVVAAAFRSRRSTRSGARPTREDLGVAVPHVVYGTLAGGLVAIPIIAALTGSGHLSPWLALALLPLTLSMGLAEFELWRHHGRTGVALVNASDLTTFGRQASASLWRTLGRYTFVLAVLSGACALAGWWIGGSLPEGTVALMIGYLALGTALLAGLVLITASRVRSVSIAIGMAIGSFFALQTTVVPPIGGSFAGVCVALMAALVAIALRDARQLVNHRYR